MAIPAKNAKPGLRYKTAKGAIMEILGTSQGNIKKDPTGENVFAKLVDEEGNVLNRKEFKIPLSYKLTRLRRPGRGRPPHPDKTWRGWAYNNAEYPAAAVLVAREKGCYLVESRNYITIGYEGRKLFVIFRHGVLGFKNLNLRWFKLYAPERHHTDFMPFRIDLKEVQRAKALPDFKQELSEFILHGIKR